MTALAPSVKGLELLTLKDNQDFPIIDTHQHLWDMERFKLQWPVPPIDNQSFLIPEYNEAVKGLNFVKSIYMEVDVPPSLRRDEALFALEICKDPSNTTVKAVICADPSEANFQDFMAEFIDNNYIMGVRCRFRSMDDMLSSNSIANLQWLGNNGLSFDLGISPQWLGAAENLVKSCPETIFILNHCGNADPIAFFADDIKRPRPAKCDAEKWKKDISKLGSYNNLYCKISGIVSHVREFKLSAELLEIPINHCLNAFSTDKVLFASDWPVCKYNMTLKNWVTILKEIVKSKPLEEQKKLFHDNAAKLYRV
jgi:predicted TIM-barrel fold metal-dependent hydrolase